jgi:PAS domain S-box-containing protein
VAAPHAARGAPLEPDTLTGFDLLSDGVVAVDAEWRCVYLNAAAAQALGRERGELVGRDIWREWPAGADREFAAICRQVAATGQATRIERHFPALGRWYELRLHAAGGGVLAIFSDVTERHETLRALAESEARMAEAERVAHFGSWRWDRGTHKVWWSDELYRIVGRSPYDYKPSIATYLDIVHPDDREHSRCCYLEALRSREPLTFRERIVRPDGDVRVVETRCRVITDPAGRPLRMVGVGQDKTEAAAAEEALQRSERRLRGIVDHIPSLVFIKERATGRYTMANNEFARLAGTSADEIVGRKMEDFFPPQEVAARLAGDEAIWTTGEAMIEETILEIDGERRNYLLQRFLLPRDEGAEPELCGVSTDVTERRQVEAERAEREQVRAQVRRALDEQRMLVYGQPIFDLAAQQVTRYELLARQRAEDGTVLEPSAFLLDAERHDAVQEIDHWMMRQAVAAAQRGRRVEVNVSSRSICHPPTADALLELLEEAGEAAAHVGVEITETAAIQHLAAASMFAQRIAALGCHVALDDFGTGYGNFTYLRTLPVHFLKIDVSFVRGMARSEDDQRIVRSIVAIAQQFGLRTVAEGVESAETLAMLHGMGVDHAQGFHIGRPELLR